MTHGTPCGSIPRSKRCAPTFSSSWRLASSPRQATAWEAIAMCGATVTPVRQHNLYRVPKRTPSFSNVGVLSTDHFFQEYASDVAQTDMDRKGAKRPSDPCRFEQHRTRIPGRYRQLNVHTFQSVQKKSIFQHLGFLRFLTSFVSFRRNWTLRLAGLSKEKIE